jgi:hypothetical protein
MGGEIGVTSIIGKGSTFTLHLRLPLDESNNESKQSYSENVIYLDAVAHIDKPQASQQPVLFKAQN